MTDNSASNWKRNAYVVGAALGLVTGVLGAYLFVRAADEKGNSPPRISTLEAIRLGAATIGLIRQIATLGN